MFALTVLRYFAFLAVFLYGAASAAADGETIGTTEIDLHNVIRWGCAKDVGSIPKGYVVLDVATMRRHEIPPCSQSDPVAFIENAKAALLSGAVFVIGTKLVSFSYEASTPQIEETLRRYSVSPARAKEAAPKIQAATAHEGTRKAGRLMVLLGAVGAVYNSFSNSPSAISGSEPQIRVAPATVPGRSASGVVSPSVPFNRSFAPTSVGKPPSTTQLQR